MIKTIRSYLLDDDVINSYVQGAYIFHEFKPKLDVSNYIVLKDKPLDMGFVETYQLDVLIVGSDMSTLLPVENRVRELLNDKRGNYIVKSDDVFIRDLTQLTGGGRQYDESKDRVVSVQYFRVKL